MEIVGQYGDGAAAIAGLREHRPDLMFLDVQMPGMDGFETLRNIPAAEMPLVVFVTAYDHYAIRAFEASATDYLLKPVEDARLHQALARVTPGALAARGQRPLRAPARPARRAERTRPCSTWTKRCKPDAIEQLRREDKLAVRDGGRTVRVELGSIRWIDAAGDYMCIHTDGETPRQDDHPARDHARAGEAARPAALPAHPPLDHRQCQTRGRAAPAHQR